MIDKRIPAGDSPHTQLYNLDTTSCKNIAWVNTIHLKVNPLCGVFYKRYQKVQKNVCFWGRVNVAVGCDCVVNGVKQCGTRFATNGRKKVWKEIPCQGKENCFQQSFDCLLNDRKCAVYCHLGMKLAGCMLDKSRRGGNWQGDK